MIQTFSEAKLLLQHLNIPGVIQENILTLFLSHGTPSANIIKSECLKLKNINHYKDNIKTLWRFKLWNSNYAILKPCSITTNKIDCEMIIAAHYPFPPSNYNDSQYKIINELTKYYLYCAFYNYDKFHYGLYGTPTANIIRNAITNNIIKISK